MDYKLNRDLEITLSDIRFFESDIQFNKAEIEYWQRQKHDKERLKKHEIFHKDPKKDPYSMTCGIPHYYYNEGQIDQLILPFCRNINPK